ncbi:membrane associated rhomboid family serine protease [Chromobacterium alkanivorans]|uniref:rhomboid family intramembrane serine protease n=1 Tax=Chromobacterium alkanivorans TaxID=1071719 RepID=UPI00216A72B4|nr:membrane associated rhomboid family serine protease [Chromobacterium alkanivorans]MCS3816948.1 membrane associated rhomboid family serine protease [Chromobacterium alkanivorans]MCS3871988.1 membrane associated rhomboid family serine protease [Chromobacterium alkanivorans]
MAPQALKPKAGAWPWGLALAVLLPLAAPWGAAALAWRFEPWNVAEWWRMASGGWVHADARHACLNSAALATLAWLGRDRASLLLMLALVAPPLIAATQWLWPAPQAFVGASGLVYCWWAALALTQPGWRGLWLAALLGRLAWQSLFPGNWSGGEPVLASAHWSGAALGLLAGGGWLRWVQSRTMRGTRGASAHISS